MILGIMQPYFLPYLGYFDLINYADNWVVFDDVSYIRHGWINRNRILHPSTGWQYINAPVSKSSTHKSIADVTIVPGNDWKRKLVSQLQHYRKWARHFDDTLNLLERCLDTDSESISQVNVHMLKCLCDHIGVEFNPQFQSQMDLELGPINNSGDWALEISKSLGAIEYVNPPGGREIFDSGAFQRAGISLTIRMIPSMTYDCRGYNFEPNLSIIDVLMWNSPDQIKAWLDVQRAKVEN